MFSNWEITKNMKKESLLNKSMHVKAKFVKTCFSGASQTTPQDNSDIEDDKMITVDSVSASVYHSLAGMNTRTMLPPGPIFQRA